MITIALPNHASRIGWLAMESLCRQITTEKWELIVYEDSDTYQGGRDFYFSYKDRLEEAGCQQIKYLYSEERAPLSQKWKKMAELAHSESLGMILQASDCYSEPLRINTAIAAFREGYDWVQSPKGVFYHVKTAQTMLFNKPGLGTALNMAMSIEHAKRLNDEAKWSGVDSWLYNQLPDNARIFIDKSSNWLNGVDTDGHNRISIERRSYYNDPKEPFYLTDLKIDDLLPVDIVKLLKEMR